MSNPLVRPLPALLVLVIAACQQAAAPEPNNQQIFTATDEAVAIGDTVWLGNTGIGVAFREVRQDSRCPSDVMCVWSGNAEVAFDVFARSTNQAAVLNTTVGQKDVVFSGYRIALKALDPTPLSTDAQGQRHYVAHISWQFMPD